MSTAPLSIASKPFVSFNGRRYWADCNRCGGGQLPVVKSYTVRRGSRPFTREVQVVEPRFQRPDCSALNRKIYSALLLLCSGCGDVVKGRETVCTHSHADKPRESCGGACLSGKRSCSCRCGGKCHGLGTCVCGNA